MKKTLMFIASFMLFFASCNQIDTELPEPFTVSKDGKSFTITSQDDLVKFVETVEKTKGITVKEVALEDFDHEVYNKTIRGKYLTKEKESVTFMIFLKENDLSKANNGNASYAADCTQRCKANANCCGCDQTVTEPCVSQVCNCHDACHVPGTESSCSAETSF
jgi:hypothetical protein